MIEIDTPEVIINVEEFILNNFNFRIQDLVKEKESTEYCAFRFTMNNNGVIFRKAKITPTKTGQFVTIWKRSEEGLTQAFELTDHFEFLMIYVENENRSGIFIFPKNVLNDQKILLNDFSAGKRGIRVYPSWNITNNRQAEKTQKWQLQYFIETTIGKNVKKIAKTCLTNMQSS
jgi:hypothetical protein